MKETIPDALRRKVFLWAAMATLMALVSIGFWALGLSAEVIATGFIFSVVLTAISISIHYRAAKGAYSKLVGVIKERGRGGFLWQNPWILIKTDEGMSRIYIREGRSFCLPDTPVEIYIRNGAKPTVVDGINTYYEYLAIYYGVKEK